MTRRRDFLAASLRAGAALPAAGLLGRLAEAGSPSLGPALRTASGRPMFPDPVRHWRGDSSVASALHTAQRPPDVPASPSPPPPGSPTTPALARRYADLPRHFIFEYYPWYGTNPYRHWDQWDRVPPLDLASHYVPSLGAYDSASAAILERHARWIADSGIGAVNLSWWGQGSREDRLVPLIMDVMRDYGLKVTFHLEPYADDHVLRVADDILYLLREYGEKRKWDAFLLLQNADGKSGPLFKGFRTILPEEVKDCHGVTHRVPDFAPDTLWRRQNLGLRALLAQDFDHLTLLADSLNFERTQAGGFDGIAIYDNFVPPSSYAAHGAGASRYELLFSFNVNPGFDAIEPRQRDPGDCSSGQPFSPPAPELDWSRADERERAAALSRQRILECLSSTLAVQLDVQLTNAQKGFFLVYVNSFNEWHEGHAFEPMKGDGELSSGERVWGYHDPADGGYRLATLAQALEPLLTPAAQEPRQPSV